MFRSVYSRLIAKVPLERSAELWVAMVATIVALYYSGAGAHAALAQVTQEGLPSALALF
jgi:hypothetical protein